MSSAEGRFANPDQPFNDQGTGNPQSWNLYGYVQNNPLKYTDPDGRTTCDADGNNCYDSVTVDGGSTDDVPFFWSWLTGFCNQAAQTALTITDTALTAISNFRSNSNCASALTVGGAAAGAAVGAYVGGGAGGTVGFAAGSVVPVAGNAAGMAGGAALGSAGGALAGGLLGGALGGVAGTIFCEPSGGGGNKPEEDACGSQVRQHRLREPCACFDRSTAEEAVGNEDFERSYNRYVYL